jgi:hypothetical protein
MQCRKSQAGTVLLLQRYIVRQRVRPNLPLLESEKGLSVFSETHKPMIIFQRKGMNAMLRLSDGQLATLMSLAQEIPRHQRSAWLVSIASSLGNRPDFTDKDIFTVAMHAKGTACTLRSWNE